MQYLEAWLGGNGCVPIYNLMEDAATAEISRAQVWQWLHHGARSTTAAPVTARAASKQDSLREECVAIAQRSRRAERFATRQFEAGGPICSSTWFSKPETSTSF